MGVITDVATRSKLGFYGEGRIRICLARKKSFMEMFTSGNGPRNGLPEICSFAVADVLAALGR